MEQTGALSQYVRRTLGVDPHIRAWAGAPTLPLFLRADHEFYEGELLGLDILFVFADHKAVSALTKQISILHSQWPGHVAYVFSYVDAKTRQRLIEARVPFVVPGNQMFLPMVAVDLRERFRPAPVEGPLTPSAQVVLLFLLENYQSGVDTAAKLARHFGYSNMTVGRALDQLEARSLIGLSRMANERRISMDDPRAVWEKAQPFLRSPVQKRFWFDCPASGLIDGAAAGLTALSVYSSIAAPPVAIVAASRREADRLFQSCEDVPMRDDAQTELEVWSYSPRLLCDGRAVDRLSLYLSLRDDHDERVQKALSELLRGLQW